MTLQDAQEFTNNQELYGQVQNNDTKKFGLARHALAGYKVDEQGNVTKQATPYFEGDAPNGIIDKTKAKINRMSDQEQLKNLGFRSY